MEYFLDRKCECLKTQYLKQPNNMSIKHFVQMAKTCYILKQENGGTRMKFSATVTDLNKIKRIHSGPK